MATGASSSAGAAGSTSDSGARTGGDVDLSAEVVDVVAFGTTLIRTRVPLAAVGFLETGSLSMTFFLANAVFFFAAGVLFGVTSRFAAVLLVGVAFFFRRLLRLGVTFLEVAFFPSLGVLTDSRFLFATGFFFAAGVLFGVTSRFAVVLLVGVAFLLRRPLRLGVTFLEVAFFLSLGVLTGPRFFFATGFFFAAGVLCGMTFRLAEVLVVIAAFFRGALRLGRAFFLGIDFFAEADRLAQLAGRFVAFRAVAELVVVLSPPAARRFVFFGTSFFDGRRAFARPAAGSGFAFDRRFFLSAPRRFELPD